MWLRPSGAESKNHLPALHELTPFQRYCLARWENPRRNGFSRTTRRARYSTRKCGILTNKNMHHPISLAFLLDDFLVIYLKLEQPFTSPLSIHLNGEELQRPFIGIPVNGLAECFVMARLPAKQAKRNVVFDIRDAGGMTIGWTEKTLKPPTRKLASQYFQRDVPQLASKLHNHLEANFGPIAADSWSRIASALADMGQSRFLPLPDGRVYFRVYWPNLPSRSLLNFALVVPWQGEVPETHLGLVEAEWLHGAFFPGHDLPAGQTYLAGVGENRRLSFSLKDKLRIDANLDPLQAILRDCPGEVAVVREFLGKVLAIESPRDKAIREKLMAVQGNITDFDGVSLRGWAMDKSNPGEHLAIEIHVDDVFVASVAADQTNPDHGTAYLQGHHSFAWECPGHFLDGSPRRVELFLPDFPEQSFAQCFWLGEGHFDGAFSIHEGTCIKGWLRERRDGRAPLTLELAIDGKSAVRHDLGAEQRMDRAEFSMALPASIHDGSRHTLTLTVLRAGRALAEIGQPQTYQANFRGAIDGLAPGFVSGWIINESAPAVPVALDLYVNGEKSASGQAVARKPELGGRRCGFEFHLPHLSPSQDFQAIALFVAGTGKQVISADCIVTPFEAVLRSLNQAAHLLKSSESDVGATEWVRREILFPLISRFRKTGSVPDSISLKLAPLVQAPHPRIKSSTVDVIVPVYGAAEETLACLQSLLASRTAVEFEIVVVNDKSPDPELTQTLRNWAADGRILLLENAHNLGFVASVNRGMRLHPERDVVLLNSDTLVPFGWLDRIRAAAYGNPAIGTVTPFSNNATICSFPNPNLENQLPNGWTLDALDAEFARANGDSVLDLPTAIGFCMYIKRRLIEDIGYFDEDQWGKGYCEENDFCLRAASLGWRNVLACGVFVQHHGSVSFGDDKARLIADNLETLNRLYPDYPALVEKFVRQDPPAQARNPIAKLLLKRHSKRYMLYVTHTLGGGTNKAVSDISERVVREGEAVLELAARSSGLWELKAYGLPYLLVYPFSSFETLLEDLHDLGVWNVHYHHTIFSSSRVMEIPEKLRIRYDVTIHDYMAICPRINMMDETGWYCGESQHQPKVCDRCVAALGIEPGVKPLYQENGAEVSKWRAHHQVFLQGARKVFTPSRDAEERINRHYQLTNTQFLPHVEIPFQLDPVPWTGNSEAHSIAVIGAIGDNKGYDLLRSCALSAAKEGLPLRFVVIGYTRDDEAFAQLDNVIVTGRYRQEDLPALIQKHQCRVAAFLSPWPETYCYALTEAWRNGLYPVAFDLGAQAERIRQVGYGELLPCNNDPKAINARVLAAAMEKEVKQPTVTIGQDYSSVLEEYYGVQNQAIN